MDPYPYSFRTLHITQLHLHILSGGWSGRGWDLDAPMTYIRDPCLALGVRRLVSRHVSKNECSPSNRCSFFFYRWPLYDRPPPTHKLTKVINNSSGLRTNFWSAWQAKIPIPTEMTQKITKKLTLTGQSRRNVERFREYESYFKIVFTTKRAAIYRNIYINYLTIVKRR